MDFKEETFLLFQLALVAAMEARKVGPVLPSRHALDHASSTFPSSLPQKGTGLDSTAKHLINDIMPALSCSSLSPQYFGFITGGCTPAALLADNLVSAMDQNVQVHLPQETLATDVELKAFDMLKELVGLGEDWGGTFISGSSVSNLMAIACGREYVLKKKGGGELEILE